MLYNTNLKKSRKISAKTKFQALKHSHLDSTVEPLYNGHFGTSHFLVIFAVI